MAQRLKPIARGTRHGVKANCLALGMRQYQGHIARLGALDPQRRRDLFRRRHMASNEAFSI